MSLILSRPMREEVLGSLVDTFIPPQSLDEQWDVHGLEEALQHEFDLQHATAELARRRP